MTEPHALSIHRVRPINGREEALDYLRQMCDYWYQKRPAFPGDAESLFREMAAQIPQGGSAPAAAAAPQPVAQPVPLGTTLLELQRMAERVVRLNPGAPGVRELQAVLVRLGVA